VQIIFFDNFDDSQLTDKLLDSGASDVILKTNTPDAGISELIKNIRYLTGRRNIQSVF
jgi:hypothetical protein